MFDWRWEGDNPADVYVVGHSHRASLVAANRIPHLRPAVRVAALHGTNEARQDPDGEYWDLACGVPRGSTLAIVWNGNQHNASLLFMPPPPFTFASVPEQPGVVVPVEMLRSLWKPTLVELEQLLERIGDSLHVVVTGTPPPKREAIVRGRLEGEPLLRQLMTDGGFDASTAPLTPGRLMIVFWQIVQDLLAEAAAAHGATFVPVPDDAFAEDGHLRDELSAPDATHANEQYGALMLRSVAAVAARAHAA